MSSSPPLSVVSKQEAAAELLKRREARASLHNFIQYINPEYITSAFSQTVCDALDRFLLDMMNGVRPILILGAPPQHGKSDIVSRYLPAYFFGTLARRSTANSHLPTDLISLAIMSTDGF